MNVAYAMVALLILGVAAFGVAALVLLISMLRAGPVAAAVPVQPSPAEGQPRLDESVER